ncbi:hypothetical protein [Shinella granuli]|uniref:DUF551 domain-containing protein n=1 Tax=Shinella granuli TaxID=323621 RepID=A0A4R2C6B7_SHIGR|nr:hypothetical protein [Shinella granuli]TCN34962.1 hypothetical protein EV665_13143 [Shinella granuli]
MRRDERVTGAWHYEIQYGPEGEANYAWLYRGAEMVATMKTHHAAALTAALEVEQPVAVEPVGEAEELPGSNDGFTIAVFKASDVPLGTKLYTSPPLSREGEDAKEAQYWSTVEQLANCEDEISRLRGLLDAAQQDYETRIRSAIVEVAVEEWQPIETAPKGVRGVAWMLLAYGPEGDQTVGVGMRFHDQFFAASTFYTGGPHDGRQFEFREHEVRPTHWRPLPTPPSSPRTSASSAEAGGSAISTSGAGE